MTEKQEIGKNVSKLQVFNHREKYISPTDKAFLFVELASQLLAFQIWDKEKFSREAMRVVLEGQVPTEDHGAVFTRMREVIAQATGNTRYELEGEAA